jgi:predicted DNA-binding WGR domain protein
MSEAAPSPLYLERIDASRNMARFYVLAVQPTLFGELSLIRRWGRIGSRGRDKIETFSEHDELTKALGALERQKRRRGYCD